MLIDFRSQIARHIRRGQVTNRTEGETSDELVYTGSIAFACWTGFAEQQQKSIYGFYFDTSTLYIKYGDASHELAQQNQPSSLQNLFYT